MRAGWKILLLSAVVFGVAFGAERLLVPDVVPVAFAEEPQSLWSLETAFVLRAIELMAAGVAVISLVITLAMLAKRLPRRRSL
jgi:hypothetical protein